jgi:hypothetical protein
MSFGVQKYRGQIGRFDEGTKEQFAAVPWTFGSVHHIVNRLIMSKKILGIVGMINLVCLNQGFSRRGPDVCYTEKVSPRAPVVPESKVCCRPPASWG